MFAEYKMKFDDLVENKEWSKVNDFYVDLEAKDLAQLAIDLSHTLSRNEITE